MNIFSECILISNSVQYCFVVWTEIQSEKNIILSDHVVIMLSEHVSYDLDWSFDVLFKCIPILTKSWYFSYLIIIFINQMYKVDFEVH